MSRLSLLILWVFCNLKGFSQKATDSCLTVPPTIKAYIENTDSIGITLTELKKGFNLLITNPEFKVIRFTFGGMTDKNNYFLYYTHPITQSRFTPDKLEKLQEHIDYTKEIFLDRIIAEKDGKRYCIHQVKYVVRR